MLCSVLIAAEDDDECPIHLPAHNQTGNHDADVEPSVGTTQYAVTVKDGTADADKWEASPNPAEAGQTVTVTYSGKKKVKSVKAKKKE